MTLGVSVALLSKSPSIMSTQGRTVVAKYLKKREVPKAKGKGTTTVYEYSDRALAERQKKKGERLEKLNKGLSKLRAQVKKDLKSEDTETRLIALCVALMDQTSERIGNSASAKGELNADKEPHFGVSTWERKHFSFGKGKATVSYTGKSGVKQKKTVTDSDTLKALRRAYDDCSGKGIFCHEDVTVNASKVNEYLGKHGGGISAKDIRGLHSNVAMKEALKRVRSKGGKLPEDKKEREKKLKDEFKEALEEVAKEVGGHLASTLKNQYLLPDIEEDFMRDGSVSDKMKTASVITRFLMRV